MMKKKKYKVEVADGFMEVYNKVPDEVAEEVETFVRGVKQGTIDPAKAGRKMNLKECEVKLLCGDCGSKNVSWYMNKNDNEVYFSCYNCRAKYWMTKEEYNRAIKKHPKCVIKNGNNRI